MGLSEKVTWDLNSEMKPGTSTSKVGGQDLFAKNPETVFQKENTVINIMVKTPVL